MVTLLARLPLQVFAVDQETQEACRSYQDQVKDWLETLKNNAVRSGTEVCVEFGKALEEQGVLGECSMQTTEATGVQVTHTSSLTLLQACHCFVESLDPQKLALAQPVYGTMQLTEALCRCGDKKYSAIQQMSFCDRVRGMLQNTFGEYVAPCARSSPRQAPRYSQASCRLLACGGIPRASQCTRNRPGCAAAQSRLSRALWLACALWRGAQRD